MGPCIVSIFQYISKKMQRYTVYLYLETALNVSGGTSTHHQVGRPGRPAGPITNTARLSPRYEGKTRGCHCSHLVPDDGRENARNMLNCKQTSE
jgi:hypothetical protein